MKIKALAFLAATMLLGFSTVQAADKSVGVLFSESGVGINYSNALPFSMRENDSLQLRLQLSGINGDGDEEITADGNAYVGNAEIAGHKVAADWFPYKSNQFFVTAGLAYLETDINVANKEGSGYTVGDIEVGNDGSTLNAAIDQSSVAPYIGIGWGNKLAGKDGLSFFAELGAMKPLDDARVSLSSTSTSVSQADVEKERREIKNGLSDIRLSATLAISYRF